MKRSKIHLKNLRGYIAVTMLMLLLMCGCSIFEQRSPEPPLVGTQTEDPLNISHVLNIADESAVSMDYRDYFTQDVEFEYSHVSRITGRTAVVNMLNVLRSRATNVVWEVDKAERRVVGGNMMIIDDLPYTVFFNGQVLCAGIAYFRVSRELSWVISYWKDVPNDGYVPFFEP